LLFARLAVKSFKRPEKSLSPAKNAKKFRQSLEKKPTPYTTFGAAVSPEW
jgi:hypothetical protein